MAQIEDEPVGWHRQIADFERRIVEHKGRIACEGASFGSLQVLHFMEQTWRAGASKGEPCNTVSLPRAVALPTHEDKNLINRNSNPQANCKSAHGKVLAGHGLAGGAHGRPGYAYAGLR